MRIVDHRLTSKIMKGSIALFPFPDESRFHFLRLDVYRPILAVIDPTPLTLIVRINAHVPTRKGRIISPVDIFDERIYETASRGLYNL
jgi:hypothetical protein